MFYKGEEIIQILSFGLEPKIQKMSSSSLFDENGCACSSSSGIWTRRGWYFGRDPKIRLWQFSLLLEINLSQNVAVNIILAPTQSRAFLHQFLRCLSARQFLQKLGEILACVFFSC